MSDSSEHGPHFGSRRREEHLRRHLSGHPDDPETHALLGLLLANRSRYREALEEAREAIRLDPDTALAYYVVSLCLAHRRIGRVGAIAEAIAAAERAIRLDPQRSGPYAQLAYLHLTHPWAAFRRRHAEAALRAAEGGLEVDPLNVPCLVLRGSALGRLGRQDEAEVAYSHAIALEPEAAYVYAAYGWLLVGRGQIERALAALHEADRLEPGSRLHRHRIFMVRGVGRTLDWLTRAAERLHLLRFPTSRPPGEAMGVNWVAGIVLGLAVLSSTRLLLDLVGDLSPLGFCLPAGVLTLLGVAASDHCRGRWRLMFACASGFLGLLWLELSALMFISPRQITATVQAAWPRLELGPPFHFVRVVGLLSVMGMLLFLIAVLLLRRMTQVAWAGDHRRAPGSE
jgi:Flp pilus assembly protein TadD